MDKRAKLLAIVAAVLIGSIAWQVTACYLANSELQSDLKDLAVQSPARTGLAAISSEQELRASVIEHAREHGITLAPQEVTVRRIVVPGMLDISLSVDYRAPIKLLGLAFPMHFTASGSHRGEVVVK